MGIRTYDIADLPLDFHPTRQLLSHLKARGMYYSEAPGIPEWQRRMAIQQWQSRADVEPAVFERLVALTYRATGVQLWVARAYASLFWVLGAAFLFLLLREHVSGFAGLIGASYYLFLPYGVIASRSFQPDGIMLCLVIVFWWLYTRWTREMTWRWALAAGMVGGLAIYVKFVAAFFVLGAALGLGLAVVGRPLIKNRQAWAMATLGSLPAALYLYYGLIEHSFLGQQFSGRFIPALLLSPGNYLQWALLAMRAAGPLAIAAGAAGLIVSPSGPVRSLLLGLCLSYVAYGLFFDYHVATHDYYHLPLIAIVAVAMGPLADVVWRQIAPRAANPLHQWALLAIFVFVLGSGAWLARSQLASTDFRPQTTMWETVGDKLGHGPNVVALTQDYGSRLAFWGWQNAIIWPGKGDAEYRRARGGAIEFEELFSKLTTGNKYFLVTDFGELDRQPELGARLSTFQVFSRGDGYVIYDLEARAS